MKELGAINAKLVEKMTAQQEAILRGCEKIVCRGIAN